MVNCFVNGHGCINLESTIELTEDQYKKINSNEELVRTMAKDLGIDHYHMLANENTPVSVVGLSYTDEFNPTVESETLNVKHCKLLHQIDGLEIKEPIEDATTQDKEENIDDNIMIIHVVHHIVFDQEEEIKDTPKETVFDVVLKEYGAAKLEVVKVVKETLNLGMKEAKDLVDSAPVTVKKSMPKKEAENLKQLLEGNGATVTLIEREVEEDLVSVDIRSLDNTTEFERNILSRIMSSILDLKVSHCKQMLNKTPITLIDYVSEDVAEVLQRIFKEFGATVNINKA